MHEGACMAVVTGNACLVERAAPAAARVASAGRGLSQWDDGHARIVSRRVASREIGVSDHVEA